MDRAYDDARRHGWSREPIVELVIPSTLDDTLAPKGAHVATLFCQHVAPELPDGRSWDDHRDEVADLMIATVDSYAPGFKASVIGRQALTPLDLERTFGLLGGDISHGADVARSAVLGTAHARLRRLPRAAARASIIAAPARIPAAASPARPDTMPRTRSSPTGAGARRGVDRRLAGPGPYNDKTLAQQDDRGSIPAQPREERHADRRGEDDRRSHPRHRGSPGDLQSDRQPPAERRHRRAALHPVDLPRRQRARPRRRQARRRQRRDLAYRARVPSTARPSKAASRISPACRMS